MPIQITIQQNDKQYEVVCDSMGMEQDGAITVYHHMSEENKEPQVVTIQNVKLVRAFQPVSSYYFTLEEMQEDGIECMNWRDYILERNKSE